MNTPLTEDQKKFLRKAYDQLFKVTQAMQDLTLLWSQDSEHGIDLNDYFSKEYPLTESFDEVTQGFSDFYFGLKEDIAKALSVSV